MAELGNYIKQALLVNANDAVTLDIADANYCAVQLAGVWTGTVTFEASLDGVTFVTLNMLPSTSTTPAGTSTGNGVWSILCGGYRLFRARFGTASSGTVSATVSAS